MARKLIFLFPTTGLSQAEIVAKGVRLLRKAGRLREREPEQLRLPFRPTQHQLLNSALAADALEPVARKPR